MLSLAARHQVIRLAAACGPAAALAAAGPALARAGVEAGRLSADGAGGDGGGGGGGDVAGARVGVLEPLALRAAPGESGVLDAEALWGEWVESAEALARAAAGPRGDPAAAEALGSALEEVAGTEAGRAAAEGVSAAFALFAALAGEGGSPPPLEEGGFVAGGDAVTERLLQLSGLGAGGGVVRRCRLAGERDRKGRGGSRAPR